MKPQHMDARRASVKALAIKVLHPLTKYQKPSLSSSALESFGITCREIDFSTGRVARGVEQFVQPVPPNLVQQWLQETKPWTVRDDFVHAYHDDWDGEDADPWKVRNTNQWEATFFGALIHIYLDLNNDGCPGIMTTRTKWAQVRPYTNKYVNRLSCGNDKPDWQLKAVYRQHLVQPESHLYNGVADFDKPHAVCYLADNAPIRDDLILTSELTALLFLATDIALKPSYQKHRIIPVTLMSGSCRTVRIVQCIFDVQKGSIEIRKSAPVHFPKGVRPDWQKYMTLLGWILGDPVGKTT